MWPVWRIEHFDAACGQSWRGARGLFQHAHVHALLIGRGAEVYHPQNIGLPLLQLCLCDLKRLLGQVYRPLDAQHIIKQGLVGRLCLPMVMALSVLQYHQAARLLRNLLAQRHHLLLQAV